MTNIVYFDMDGVLCDFNKAHKKMFGYGGAETPEHLKESNWKQWVESESFANLDYFECYQNVRDIIDTAFFFKQKGVVDKISILSSTGGKGYHEQVKKQKLKWLKSHNLYHDFDEIHFVEHGVDKGKFASPYSILIDDTAKVAKSFRGAGGLVVFRDGKLKEAKNQLIDYTELIAHRSNKI